jgi:hypothetical protein
MSPVSYWIKTAVSFWYSNEALLSIFLLFFRLGPNQKEYVDRRGVHVVVGHYMGETSKSQNPPNLTDGETDP